MNVVLSTTQIVVGMLSKSLGLTADCKHCLSDLTSDFAVLLANHPSQKDAGEDHPYGHQRFEKAALLALGAILLTVGVGMLWPAAVKHENPEAIPQVYVVALYGLHDLMDRAVNAEEASATCATRTVLKLKMQKSPAMPGFSFCYFLFLNL